MLLSQDKESSMNLSSETLTAHFAPEGWLTTLEGQGSVQGSRNGAKESENLNADNASLDLLPKTNQPKQAVLRGNVQLRTSASGSGEERVLQTDAFLLEFAEPGKGESAKPKHAETLSSGTIEWTDAVPGHGTTGSAATSAQSRTKLQGDKLEMAFGDEYKAKELTATGNVRLEKTSPGKPSQTATAKNGSVQLLADGGWTQMDLHGGVNLREAARSGQADHAVFFRATQTAVLTGKAVARDATTETRAPRITFAQATGEILAEGGVRSTDFSSKTSSMQLAPVPANITAVRMQGNSKTGRALYTGNARLWQGDSVLEADSIELLRETQVLNAKGNVRAVFPQTTASSALNSRATSNARKPALWHVTASTLTYSDAESRAHLEKNVVAQSADQTMRAPVVDLYFTRPAPAGAKAASSSSGPQQISSARGTGGVIVEQGTRQATAERGEYYAADGKFIMSGGSPTIYDASEGTTTGRQLTFFLADDTIIVDSESGSRTLTKHRVE
jgi:lipopolysaccharide export system protein LptA